MLSSSPFLNPTFCFANVKMADEEPLPVLFIIAMGSLCYYSFYYYLYIS